MGDPEDREGRWDMLSSAHGAAIIFMNSLDKTCTRASQWGWSTLQQVLEIGLSGLQKMGEEVGPEHRKQIFGGAWGRRGGLGLHTLWSCQRLNNRHPTTKKMEDKNHSYKKQCFDKAILEWSKGHCVGGGWKEKGRKKRREERKRNVGREKGREGRKEDKWMNSDLIT